MNMQELLIKIVQSLVDKPDQVSVTRVDGDSICALELTVAKEDLGKVIGRQGRIAQAMRTLVGAVASKQGRKAIIEILE